MYDEISNFITKYTKHLRLDSNEKPKKWLLISILIVILFPPLVSRIHDAVSNILYLEILKNITSVASKNLSPADIILLLLLSAVILSQLYLYNLSKRDRLISDNFSQGLSKWSLHLNSNWSIKKADKTQMPGNLLEVTNSNFPGLLKAAFGWYDYVFKFEAYLGSEEKIKKIGIHVRSESTLSGVMFQISNKKIVPHYLHNGQYIIDDHRVKNFQNSLPSDEWISFKVTVKGNDVTIAFLNQVLHMEIVESKDLYIDKSLMYGTKKISELEEDSKNNEQEISELLSIDGKILAENDHEKKRRLKTRKDELLNKLSSSQRQRFTLEYHMGSVGFREDGSEKVLFRNIKLERLD